MTLTAKWVDSEREPKCAPNPQFPNGIDVDMSEDAQFTCSIDLPYPAKRCGVYIITCGKCRQTNALTTAGRIDDPRTVTFGCYANTMDPHPGLTEIVLPDTSKMIRTPHHMSAESQGPCETTLTERFSYPGCKCGTYEGNLGPCKTYETGMSGRCVYCEHGRECHDAVKD